MSKADDVEKTASEWGELIPRALYHQVQRLWPLLSELGSCADPELLLAIAYVQSGLDENKLFHLDEESTAQRLTLRSWDMSDTATAIAMAACRLADTVRCFGLGRLAVAAFFSSCDRVREAGGQVPDDPAMQRQVRDVMAVWSWVARNPDGMLDVDSPWATARSAGPLVPPPWWVDTEGCPPQYCMDSIVDDEMVDDMQQEAARRARPFVRNETERTVYVCDPLGRVHLSKKRLIVPVPGANRSCNGAFVGAPSLDIIAPFGSPVVASADGIILRADEHSVLVLLNRPLVRQGRGWRFALYGNLYRRRHPPRHHIGPAVVQGEVLGWSGLSGRLPCASLGLWEDREGRSRLSAQALAEYFGWGAQ